MKPGAIAAVTTALLLVGCGEAKDHPSAPVTAEDPGVIHIHGLGRNPVDDALFIATHTGLFRMGASDRAPQRVANREQRGWVSRDGGASWRPLPIPGGMLTWTRELGLIAVDLGGVLRSASEPTGAWTRSVSSPGRRQLWKASATSC